MNTFVHRITPVLPSASWHWLLPNPLLLAALVPCWIADWMIHSRRLGRCDSVLVIGHDAAALPVHFAVPSSLEPGGFAPCCGATWIGQTARRCRQSREGMFALDLEPATDFSFLVATLKHAAAITPLSCGLDSRCAVDARKGGKKQEPGPAQKPSLVAHITRYQCGETGAC